MSCAVCSFAINEPHRLSLLETDTTGAVARNQIRNLANYVPIFLKENRYNRRVLQRAHRETASSVSLTHQATSASCAD